MKPIKPIAWRRRAMEREARKSFARALNAIGQVATIGSAALASDHRGAIWDSVNVDEAIRQAGNPSTPIAT